LKVLLANLLAALNFANFFLNKKNVWKIKNVKKRKNVTKIKKRKNRFFASMVHSGCGDVRCLGQRNASCAVFENMHFYVFFRFQKNAFTFF